MNVDRRFIYLHHGGHGSLFQLMEALESKAHTCCHIDTAVRSHGQITVTREVESANTVSGFRGGKIWQMFPYKTNPTIPLLGPTRESMNRFTIFTAKDALPCRHSYGNFYLDNPDFSTLKVGLPGLLCA